MHDAPAVEVPSVAAPHIADEPRRTGRRTDRADARSACRGNDAAILQTPQHGRLVRQATGHLAVTALHIRQILQNHLPERAAERIVASERTDEALGETVAAPKLHRVDDDGTQGLAGHLSQLVADVHANGPGIGQMHRYALHFQRHGPLDGQGCRSEFFARCVRSEFLDQTGIGRRMGHRAVAGHRLGQYGLPQHVRRRADEPFDVPVLEAEYDFEVADLLAVADEAEHARLDDPGMDGSHIDLVQRLAPDLVEGIVRRRAAPVEPVGGAVQNLVGGHGIDQAETGQGSGGPAGFSLQGGGGGNRAQKQDQGAEQGKDSFFHGISLHQKYSSYCSTVKPALQVGKRGHLPTGQAADGLV